MTDLPTGLGATAPCPRCGEQVQITGVAAALVRCPACGTPVPTGVRPEVAADLTAEELIRAYGVSGYDDDAVAEGDRLRCSVCGASTAAGEWPVDDVRRASSAETGDTEVAVAAVRCPACGAAERAVMPVGAAPAGWR